MLRQLLKNATTLFCCRCISLLCLCLTGATNAAASMPSLWQEMAITAAQADSFPFVISDNRAGYFEGRSFRYDGGVGYRYRETTLIQDCLSFAENKPLDRRSQAHNASHLPFSIRHGFEQFSETLMLHGGQSIISCRLNAKQASRLAIAPLGLFNDNYEVLKRGPVVLIKARDSVTKDVPAFVAINASKAFELAPLTSSQGATPLAFQSGEAVSEFTVQFAFASSAQQALQLAQQFTVNDRWQNSEQHRYQQLSRLQFRSDDAQYNRALWWAHASAQSFVVDQFGVGIWAGLPWFRDNWGRDTFIALPGTALVNGDFATAKKIIENFWRYQFLSDKKSPNYGRVPNRVAADSEIIYNTVDGTPWLIRELYEYAMYSGDRTYALQQLPRIDAYIDGVKQHWLDQYGLLTHDDADTWMDARIDNKEAWSPRGNRAVEIQALWITALEVAAQLHSLNANSTQATAYQAMAARAREALLRLFWQDNVMADRLRADNSRDTTMRPNQLMAISIPFTQLVTPTIQLQMVRDVARELFLPYGVLSLSPTHPAFHPKHQNDHWHHKDAAYHNGTIWGWNSGFAISALTRVGRADLAWQMSSNLSSQILCSGHRGSLSELVDATLNEHGEVTPSGTYAQAWSVAEFVRNAYQDYLGFKPNLLQNKIEISPSLPPAWRSLTARLRCGDNATIDLTYKADGVKQHWQFAPQQLATQQLKLRLQTSANDYQTVSFKLAKKMVTVDWDGENVFVNNIKQSASLLHSALPKDRDEIQFRAALDRDLNHYPATTKRDQLKQRLMSGESVF